MKEKFRQFMIGRYGTDQLSRFLIQAILMLMIINLLVHSEFLMLVGVAGLIVCYFRMFSKNISKRYQENQKFLGYRFIVIEQFRKMKYRVQDYKTHHIYRCPNCRQKIRIPRGKGKISIHCPKCKSDFIKKS